MMITLGARGGPGCRCSLGLPARLLPTAGSILYYLPTPSWLLSLMPPFAPPPFPAKLGLASTKTGTCY